MRGVIYTRISKDDEGDNASLQTQYENCLEMCDRLGITVIERFSEDYTGMELERPKLIKLRKMIYEGRVDAIIVNTSDRLTRKVGHGEILLDEMSEYGVRLFIAYGFREIKDSPDDRFMFSIQQKLDTGKANHKIGIKKYDWLMGKRLVCGVCDLSMYGVSKQYRYKEGVYQAYYCSSLKPQTRVPYCHNGPYNSHLVDNCVWGWVVDLFNDPQSLRGRLEEAKVIMEDKNADKIARIKQIDKTIDNTISRLESLLEETIATQHDIAKRLLRQKTAETQATYDDLLKERQALTESLGEVTINDRFVDDFETYARGVRGKLADATFDEKRKLIEALGIYGVLSIEDGKQVLYLKWYHYVFELHISPDTGIS